MVWCRVRWVGGVCARARTRAASAAEAGASALENERRNTAASSTSNAAPSSRNTAVTNLNRALLADTTLRVEELLPATVVIVSIVAVE